MNDGPELELAWTRSEKKISRGPQPALRPNQIAAGAIRVADAEGLDAVSMRRIAAELGTKAMSLYRYVRSKEDLIDLMVDAATGRSRLPKPNGDWRDDLTALAQLQRATARKHPWLISVSIRSTLGPHGLAWNEALLHTVDGYGLTADQMLLVVVSVSTFVRGYVAEELADQQARKRTGVSRAAWMKAQTHYVSAVREAGEYPLFIKIIDEAETPHNPQLLEERFERCLDFLLDGIAMRLFPALTSQPRKGSRS